MRLIANLVACCCMLVVCRCLWRPRKLEGTRLSSLGLNVTEKFQITSSLLTHSGAENVSLTRGGASSTSAFVVGPAAASVLAGSLAGAIGVGVAFPFDTLKTKAQVLGPEACGMIQTIRLIWTTEGLSGFFGKFFVVFRFIALRHN
jgi:hypothetical protein